MTSSAPVVVNTVFPALNLLGEGPNWDVAAQRLRWVDIDGGRIHAYDPATGEREDTPYAAPVSFAVPRAGGGLVVGARYRVIAIDPDGTEHVLAEVETEHEANRFNDAKCDAAGRLWAGTMSTVREPGVSGLYRIDPDGAVEQVISGTTISNGLAWSPDGGTFYFIDSPTQNVDALDFDADRGTVSNRRTLLEIDPEIGLPDGMTCDADGGLWIAFFGGGAVRRYSADGELEAVVDMPASHTTCPAFGGPELTTIYVTSTRHRLTPEQEAAEPLAGSLFSFEAGVRGQAHTAFGG